MSRNWTPRELHAVDEWTFAQRGEYLHDSRIVMVENKDGKREEFEMGCKRYPDLYEKYPNLCFLLEAENVKKMYNDNLAEELAYVEALLINIMATDDKGHFSIDEEKEAPRDVIVKKWYDGKLDRSFYYSEENHSMLVDYMYFWKFVKDFKVGDKAYYDMDEFDMVKPQTIECVIRAITADYIMVEADYSDHIILDFDCLKEYKFRKAV